MALSKEFEGDLHREDQTLNPSMYLCVQNVGKEREGERERETLLLFDM